MTARDRQSADQTPYPGNVNQPDRKDPSWEQYHTFEQQINHELPDMRHQWQDDSRDDIGFGIPEAWGKGPTVASVRVAANKCVRIATLLLGEKVEDEVIEAQATDFMMMGQAAMDRTLQRFADTQKLYAEDEKVEEKEEDKKAADEGEKKDEEKKEVKADAAAPFTPTIDKPGAEAKCGADDAKTDEKVEDKKDEKVASIDVKAAIAEAVASALESFKAALPDFIQKKVDEKKDDKKAADEKDDEKKAALPDFIQKKVDEKKDDKKAADEKDEKDDKACSAADESKKDEKVEEKKEASAPRMSANEMDIELTGAMDDQLDSDPEADERLASLFDNDGLAQASANLTAGTSGRKAEASQKAGIKRLGGQPRVASADGGGVQDISSIWQSAPDVSEAFR
jgi:hypothetical protein